MLLTRLTAFDLCAGRLLAWLWPLESAVFASLAVWLTVKLVWIPEETPGPGHVDILVAHAVLLLEVLAAGAVAFLCALRRRPGRVWLRGTLVALALVGAGVTGLFALNPVVRRMEDPTRLIDGLLTVNPAMGPVSAMRADVLRIPWLYVRTDAAEYPFEYPSPLLTMALYGAIAGGAAAASAVRLRRAYR